MSGLKVSVICLLFVSHCDFNAQVQKDTIKITQQQADQLFLSNNLQLLAYRFNIGASEAAIMQAKLWDNPNISIEQNIYNQYTKKYFDITATGNTGIQIQQLFKLAGKRNKQIQLASISKDIAEFTFYDLLRALKFELHSDFNDLFYLQQSLKFYDESIPSVKKTINSIEGVYESHSILLSEILRLKSLLFSLENDRLTLYNQISELENDISVLINDETSVNKYYSPDLNQEKIENTTLVNLVSDSLADIALENRPDYKIAKATVKSDEINLKLQKALAVPDLTVAGIWSRQGSYIYDYYALQFSIDLPIFNRNQGNILLSKNNLDADSKLLDQTRLNVEREVKNAYNKAIETERFYKSFDKKFTVEYKNMISGVLSNYQKRYITIIEFTDFYESYRNSIVQMNQLQNSRTDAFENLNYKVGTDVVKYQ
jgi:cobalt-zinc-cadmium efflux system outer membrane protein